MNHSIATLAFVLLVAACASSSAPPTDAGPRDAASSDVAACRCDDAFNVTATATGGTLGQGWLAWRYTPSCSFAVDTIDAATNAAAFGLFAEKSGAPGDALVAEVPAAALATRAGWSRATLPATALSAGTSYWVGIKANPGGIDSTTAPFASSGATTDYVGGSPGAWTAAGVPASVMFEMSAACH